MSCIVCHERIPPGQKALRNYGKIYHFKCVNCAKCQQQMSGYVKLKDDKFYHGHCFHCIDCDVLCEHDDSIITSEGVKCGKCGIKCVACNKLQTDDWYMGKRIHKECHKCYKCGLTDTTVLLRKNVFYHRKCSGKKCVVCFETLGPDKKKVLGFNLHSKCDKTSTCYCAHKMIDLEQLWVSKWTFNTHTYFSKEVKATIFQLMLIKQLRESILSKLPKDIFYLLFQYIATPAGWNSINGYLTKDVCFNGRCRFNRTCLCDRKFSLISSKNKCNKTKCLYYSFKCPLCSTKIPYDSNPLTTCTAYRCINQKCDLCFGELKHIPTDDRNLCDPDSCQTFLIDCKCGNLIRRVPINPTDECTVQRCLKDKCLCGLVYEPFLNSKNGCVPTSCHTKTKEKEVLHNFLKTKLIIPEVETDKQRLIHYRLALANLLPQNKTEDYLIISKVLNRWLVLIQ